MLAFLSSQSPQGPLSLPLQTLRVSLSTEAEAGAVAEPEEEVVASVRIAGSARERFARERLAALHTAAEFGRIAYRDASACRCCYAGLEPASFQELFPQWLQNPEGAESHTKVRAECFPHPTDKDNFQ